MGDNRSSLLGIVALIIGVSGLGIGIFTFLDPFAVEEPEGIEYPVSSETEMISALNAIGTGYGIITITHNITLINTIDINHGGNYIIQGVGATLKCASNQGAFNITNAGSLTIQNVKIDTTDVVTTNLNIIQINEINDNPIYIRNVHIIGDSNTIGRGIYINSDNVWVIECNFDSLAYAIWQDGGKKAHIYDNIINYVGTGGIRLTGISNIIDGNLITNTGLYGIWSESLSYYSTISNNIIYFFDQWGIRISADKNIISGNYIQWDNDITESAGIYVDGSYNTINGNGCFNIEILTILYGFGIRIAAGNNNTVVGNTCLFNEMAFYDAGSTDTYVYGNQFY
ncbi:MAG: NosD domain-containing protein [Promethearchaeota archaeon]